MMKVGLRIRGISSQMNIIPLPVRDHIGRITAETRQQLELKYVAHVEICSTRLFCHEGQQLKVVYVDEAVETLNGIRGAKFFYVKGSHRPRPLTRLRRSLIDKTTPITLIRTRRMRIDEFVCIMAVGDRWRSLLLSSVKPQGRNKMCIGLTVYPNYSQYREFPHQRHGIKCAPS